MLLNAISKLLRHRWTWRVTGFVSSIVGFYCYALSPSLRYLIGAWSLVKKVVYGLVSALVCTSTLLVHRDSCAWARGSGPFLKTLVGFAALVITSVLSFLEDRSEEGKQESGYGKMMNVISGAAFVSMTMSFSMELELGFEVGVSNFMIGWLLVRAMKVRLMIAIVATLFCYMLVNLRHLPRKLRRRNRYGGFEYEDSE
ncbi:uncharacterized protein LOC109812363 [Cajanus cajan]|uniref:Uncharacterized protein n=1 Tax=Cajanus cajan TaxID=3821 RepID=A0A151S7L5_CAJCA|nr:uncharacterized protein LOC109812363 [Cajanus cajan]KYP50815.1 hypothetical protein KK1_027380 [Cajanus cajan]